MEPQELMAPDGQQLSNEQAAPPAPPEPTAIDAAREQMAADEPQPKPILGRFKDESELAAYQAKVEKEREDFARELEEYRRSQRIQQARQQDQEEKIATERAKAERLGRVQALYEKMQKYAEAQDPVSGLYELEKHVAETTAALTQHLVQRELEAYKPLLAQVNAAQSLRQFKDVPELEDIHDMAEEAVILQAQGWQPEQIVPFLRSIKQKTGGGRRQETVADLEEAREQRFINARRSSMSESPDGGMNMARPKASTQEKAEAKARADWFTQTFGPIPKRK